MSAKSSTRRLFFALVPPRELQARLVAGAARALGTRALEQEFRPIATEELHLTLCFLGAFPGERVCELALRARAAMQAFSPPKLRISGGGAFPSVHRAQVLWLGVQAEHDALVLLHEGLVDAARHVDWRPGLKERSKPFSGHITVARSRQARAARPPPAPAELLASSLDEPWSPAECVLLESGLEHSSERYLTVDRFVFPQSNQD